MVSPEIAGRRKDVVYTGSAFSQDHFFAWGYNDRSELTNANRYEGADPDDDDTPMGDHFDYDYGYDPIGNRQSHAVDGDDDTLYAANSVNQYLLTANPSQTFQHDADGNMTAVSASGADGPMLVRAWSVKDHTDVGDFAIPLPLVQPASASVECRVGGPTRIMLEFTEAVTLDDCNNVSLSSGSCSGVTPLGGNLYEVAISGATANACLTLELVSVESDATSDPLVGVDAVNVVVLSGDVDGTGAVNIFDLGKVISHYGWEVTADTFRYDTNSDGEINLIDRGAVYANLNQSASCTLPTPSVEMVYTWDAENRLIEVAPADPAVDDVKLTFVYDYRSRRVARQVHHWDGAEWDTDVDDDLQMFVYDEWNVALVLKGSTETVTHQYTWGLDLSGLSGSGVGPASSRSSEGIHNAGGIGGLLATVETQGTSSTTDDDNYWHFYDGNGNVGQLLEYDASGDMVSTTPAAHYEYDPYGQLLRTTGAYADANPFRFSTKWFEADFGIGDWGYRWYWLRYGRWGSRDPIEERGGPNVNGFLNNNAISRVDLLGQQAGCDSWMCPRTTSPPPNTFEICVAEVICDCFNKAPGPFVLSTVRCTVFCVKCATSRGRDGPSCNACSGCAGITYDCLIPE